MPGLCHRSRFIMRALGCSQSPLPVLQSCWGDAGAKGGNSIRDASSLSPVWPAHPRQPSLPSLLHSHHVPRVCKHFGFPALPAQASCRFRACCCLKTYQVSCHLLGPMNLRAGDGAGTEMTLQKTSLCTPHTSTSSQCSNSAHRFIIVPNTQGTAPAPERGQ